MGAKIEHLDREALNYFAREFQKQILEHIMCQDASNYYEEQYHKLFSTTYETRFYSVHAVDGTNDYTADHQSIYWTYKVILVKIEKRPLTADERAANEAWAKLPDGSKPPYPPYRTDENGVYTKETNLHITKVDGMMGDDGPIVPTEEYLMWTFRYNHTLYRDTDYATDYRKTFTAQASGEDNGKIVTGSPVSTSTVFSFVRPNMWLNDVTADVINADWFKVFMEELHGELKFSTGKNQEFQTVQGKPLIFLSPNANLNFEQFGSTIIQKKITMQTFYGPYTAYITGNGNGSVWNAVTIS